MAESDFVTGSVKWFDPSKGYGFVIHNGKDIFVHSKKLRESGIQIPHEPPSSPLEPGQKLRFKIADGPKGLHAVEISKV
jgi:CspA family cold shock protein